jgi:hypothetical protein
MERGIVFYLLLDEKIYGIYLTQDGGSAQDGARESSLTTGPGVVTSAG